MKNVIIYGINWTNCYALQSIFLSKNIRKSALKRVTH